MKKKQTELPKIKGDFDKITQEDKELLIKDMAGRLPYSPKVWDSNTEKVYIVKGMQGDGALTLQNIGLEARLYCGISQVKPILRPMDKMTEEEKEIEMDTIMKYLGDFYNKHNIDFHGMIEKGLAIEENETLR